MDQTHLNLSVTEPIGLAIARTKRVLFAPFAFGKWFGLGFCAFLAELLAGGGSGGNFSNLRGGVPGGRGGGGARQTVDWVDANLGLVISVSIAGVFAILAVIALLSWLQSRGKFMFLDGVVHNRGNVSRPWRRYRHLGNSLFGFTMLMTVLGFFSVLLWAAVGTALAWPDIMANRFDAAAITGLVVGGGLLTCTGIALAIISALLEHFVVPAMYLHEVRVGEAWTLVREELLAGRFWTIVLFILMRFVLGIGVAVIAVLAVLLTCCIGALPYLSSVVLLPLTVFMRCYSLYFIEQYGPRWQFFARETWPPYCAQCEYDLRASPGQFCPECGTEIPYDQQALIASGGAPPSNDPQAPPPLA